MKERPLILVTNDDGITAPGIRHLVESVADCAVLELMGAIETPSLPTLLARLLEEALDAVRAGPRAGLELHIHPRWSMWEPILQQQQAVKVCRPVCGELCSRRTVWRSGEAEQGPLDAEIRWDALATVVRSDGHTGEAGQEDGLLGGDGWTPHRKVSRGQDDGWAFQRRQDLFLGAADSRRGDGGAVGY